MRVPVWATQLRRFTTWAVEDAFGGPRPWKLAWAINFQKTGTFPFLAFPDPAWQRRITIGGGINTFLAVLGWYWVFGWLLIAGHGGSYPLPASAWFALCISLCLLGTAIMMAADAQKYFTLREKPGLITCGLHRHVRHPNYLGEMMIYASFALMVWHWLPFLVLAWVWGGVFAVNMIHKEASLARHSGWSEYRRRTGWLLPRVL